MEHPLLNSLIAAPPGLLLAQQAAIKATGRGASDPNYYDQEVFLAVHPWERSLVPVVEMMQAQSANHPLTSGSDVGYKHATINQHRLGVGEPLRVKQGRKVLMYLLNASATENVVLALPGHTFRIIAMDGNPVPNPQKNRSRLACGRRTCRRNRRDEVARRLGAWLNTGEESPDGPPHCGGVRRPEWSAMLEGSAGCDLGLYPVRQQHTCAHARSASCN